MGRHDNPVVHPFAVAASCNDSSAAEVSQVPRYFGLWAAQDFNKEANANLLLSHEVEQP